MTTYTNDPLAAIDWGTSLATRRVDVWFAPAGETFRSDPDGPTLRTMRWAADEIAMTMDVLARFTAVAQVTFRRTASPDGAEFRLAIADLNAGDDGVFHFGFMNPPGEDPPGKLRPGDGVIDFRLLRWMLTATGEPLDQPGGVGWWTMNHLVGLGLGLAHPYDEGGSSPVLEGVRPRPDGGYTFGAGRLNQGVYTMMSSNEGWPAEGLGALFPYAWGAEAGPMALDVAVLQQKYGANMEHATGDDVYRLPTRNAVGAAFYECVWDAGGDDGIAHGGARDAVIDLRAATLKAGPGGGGRVSHVEGVRGGLTIANGVTIERATGWAGDDRLLGNGAGNVLLGGRGDDAAFGYCGDDVIRGDDGADRLSGLAGRDTLVGGAGDDLLDGGLGRDLLVGGDGRDMFRFAAAAASPAGPGADAIADFDAQRDAIDLRAIDADPTTACDDAFRWIGDAPFDGRRGDLRWEPGVGLEADRDGDGLADFAIAFEGFLVSLNVLT